MENVITVGFILTAAAFFTKVFGLKGYWSLLAAFVVGVVAVEYPVLIAAFPQAALYFDPVVKLIAVVVAASGSYDITKELAKEAGSK